MSELDLYEATEPRELVLNRPRGLVAANWARPVDIARVTWFVSGCDWVVCKKETLEEIERGRADSPESAVDDCDRAYLRAIGATSKRDE